MSKLFNQNLLTYHVPLFEYFLFQGCEIPKITTKHGQLLLASKEIILTLNGDQTTKQVTMDFFIKCFMEWGFVLGEK